MPPAEIDDEYKAKLKRIVRRNIYRKEPIRNIFGRLAAWRSITRAVAEFNKRSFAFDKRVEDIRRNPPPGTFFIEENPNLIH